MLRKSLPFITLYASDSSCRQDKSFSAEAGRIPFMALLNQWAVYSLAPKASVRRGWIHPASSSSASQQQTEPQASLVIHPGPREMTTPQSKQQGSRLTRYLFIGGSRNGEEDAGHQSRAEGWRASNYPGACLFPFFMP